MSDVIINKVAESALSEIDPANFYPHGEVAVFDMKDYLFMGLILKEKDFREALKVKDLSPYQDKYVSVICSADAIIPVWAYMLATSYLETVAKTVYFGTGAELSKVLLTKRIEAIDAAEYADKRVVIKGCGDTPIPEEAYVAITNHLRPVVKSLMYGEPCSTVPIYKKASK